MPITTPIFTPYPGLIDPVNSSRFFGVYKGQSEGFGGTAPSAYPFLYGGQQYLFTQGVGTYHALSISQWLGGAWVQLDAAHAPTIGTGNGTTAAVLFDGAQTVTVGWNPTNTVAGLGALTLQDFDLATGLWVPSTYPAGPNVYIVNQLFRRSEGSIVVLTGGVSGSEALEAQVLAGGAWSTVSIADGTTPQGGSAAVLDSATDDIHVFFLTELGGGVVGAHYVRFDLADAVAASANFTAADFYCHGWNIGITPVLVGNTIYLGVTDPTQTFPTLLIGTPLTAPVFTVAHNLDPAGPTYTGPFFFLFPAITYDPTDGYYYAVWSPDLVQMRFCSSPDGVTWTGTTMFATVSATSTDGTQYGPNAIIGTDVDYFGLAQLGTVPPVLYFSFEIQPVITPGAATEYLFRITQAPAPVTVANLPAMGAATGARFKPCNRYNDYNAAQLAEKVRIERAKRRDWPYRQLYPVELDITVNKLAQIAAPAANVLTAVLIYRVPQGFRFWMDAILQDGPEPFTPGDVSWTVDINAIVPNTAQAASVHGLINIPVPLGSTVTGEVWHFTMPYFFEPLTVVRSRIVNVNVPEGPPNYFTSGFFGFLVPVTRGH